MPSQKEYNMHRSENSQRLAVYSDPKSGTAIKNSSLGKAKFAAATMLNYLRVRVAETEQAIRDISNTEELSDDSLLRLQSEADHLVNVMTSLREQMSSLEARRFTISMQVDNLVDRASKAKAAKKRKR